METLFFLAAGLAVLVLGADLLVRGAARVAASLGIAPLIIGLTIVAFGTSMPEMVVSVTSAYKGAADVAVGNVVGSNIFNVLFILGVSALVAPLAVSTQLIRLDVPVMILVSVVLYLMGLDGALGKFDGAILFAGILIYTWYQIRLAKQEPAQGLEDFEKEFGKIEKPGAKEWVKNLAFIAAGLVLLIVGSQWLVESAVAIAQSLGVSELVIGLTIVAAGTSLPEVATSVMASIKGERDIAVGNVVGSNIFNILAVLGASSLMAPSDIGVSRAALHFDIPVMIAVAVACFPIFFSGSDITRREGAVFLAFYVAYTAYLVLAASSHDALGLYSNVMLYAVLPLTVLALLLISLREWKKRRV